jgi:hypothetical protein
MTKVLTAVAVTLLAAVVSVVPAALIGRYVPAIFDAGLKPIAVAAWISGLLSWSAAREISKHQARAEMSHEADRPNGFAVGMTLGLLVLAVGIAVGLHYYGDKLLR